MKRFLLSVIVLVTGLAQANAQIQREFLGCSLGASPQEVFQVISDKGYNIENTDDGFRAWRIILSCSGTASGNMSSSPFTRTNYTVLCLLRQQIKAR